MPIDSNIITWLWKPFGETFKFIDQYLVSNILAFVKGFEVAVVVLLVLVFLLIAVGTMMRQAKRLLPKSYVIDIKDFDGRQIVGVDGLRQVFSTYEAAESYARFYRQKYSHQYTFKVIGSRSCSGEIASYAQRFVESEKIEGYN